MIKFFGLSKEKDFYGNELFTKAYKEVTKGIVLQSNSIKKLELSFTKYLNKKYAVALGSCTDALFFSLLTLNLPKKSEIMVSSFSYIASASCIIRAGYKPVFIDINDDFNMDLKDAEKKISHNTRAIIVVNLFGLPNDFRSIKNFADKNKIKIIEDNAQSLGASFFNKKAGSNGEISCMSFDPTKVLATYGSGGLIATDNYNHYKKISKLRYHGKSNNQFQLLGYNSQLSTFNAEILLYKMKYLDHFTNRRNEIANLYRSYFKYLPIKFPIAQKDYTHAYHKFVIILKNRNKLKLFLEKNGVQTMIHYKKSLNKEKIFQKFKNKCPNAEKLSKNVLSLPIHNHLTNKEIKKISNLIKKFYHH